MASDLSSVGADDIFEEKEEGEISLEDVSSSEESHPNYRSDFRTAGRCTNCTSALICAPWCGAARAARKTHKKLDAVHGKENRRHAKDLGSAVLKHMVATLQEKNDDLVPISSDSDMEIVGLPGNSKQLHERSKSAKVRKKKKKKRSHSSVVRIEEALSPTQVEMYPVDVPAVKKAHSSRSHHREKSPSRYNARSPVERPLARSPSRRFRATRALKSRSPVRRSRSPATRANAAEKKSPRKVRSPRRSPTSRSPLRSSLFRDAREHASLLKKVRRLESVGVDSTTALSNNKEHSSLKEKLSNMIKNENAGSIDKPSARKRPRTFITKTNNNNNNSDSAAVAIAAAEADVDDEDDIELLRRLALETKQKKSENKIEESNKRSEIAEESDDNDIEANELRILALRSAMMKKHEKRVTRGIRSKRPAKSHPRVESPFNESFLDDFRISEEENSNVESPTTRLLPIFDDESNHPEDMDIDTDVEREKEQDFMPYSPTDDLFREFVEGAELPETNDNSNEDEKLLSSTESEKFAMDERHTSPEGSDYTTGAYTPYSPSASIEAPNEKKIVSHQMFHDKRNKIALVNMENLFSPEQSDSNRSLSNYLHGVDTPYSPCVIDKFLSEARNNHINTDSPESPQETPILDPVLFPIFPNLPSVGENIEGYGDNVEQVSSAPKIEEAVTVDILRNSAITSVDEKISVVFEAEKDSEISLPLQKEKDCQMLMDIEQEDTSIPIDTIEKLPEIDLDGSPLVSVSKELDGAELAIPIENSPEIVDPVSEPLYLQSLLNVTKPTSTIPTLVNRTLVPALILKTNKQLQQPLNQKKVDHPAEPSFKSAEMRPVNVETYSFKPTTLFKPIKLCPILKKPQVMTSAAAAFNTSFGDESAKETQSDDESAIVQVPAPVNETQPITTTTVAKSPTAGTSQKVDAELDGKKKTSGKNKKRRSRRLRDDRKTSKESANCAKQQSSNRGKSGEANSSSSNEKKIKSAVRTSTSKVTERVTRASSRSSHMKSSENSKAIVAKSLSIDKSTERKASVAKNDKTTLSNKGTEAAGEKKPRSPRKKLKSIKKLKRLSSNIESQRNKLSEPDLTKSIEQRDHKSKEKEQKEIIKNEEDVKKSREELNKVEEAERQRRSSVDEDEEALRALLLASLPKRTKPLASPSTSVKNSDATSSLLSDTTTGTCLGNLSNKAGNESNVCSANSVFTPVNSSTLPSQSSNTDSGMQVKRLEATTNNEEVASKFFANQSNISGGVELTTLSPRKRANPVVPKGPPKKILKKASPVLASTKVVNNAKKYQNALMQKKLNVQRAAVNYSGPNGSRNITLNNIKNNDANRPSSPKISAASKMQRLVINLGSDTDTESDPDSQMTGPTNGDIQSEARKPLTIPTTDFEKSVVQFLKDQRQKLESVKILKTPTSSAKTTATTTATTTTTTTNNNNNNNNNKIVGNSVSSATGKLTGLYNTPLAVRRHLPVSQQEEYRRLKQQIVERERQKLQKTIENGSASQNPSLQSPCTPPGPLSPASPIAAIQKSQTIQKLTSVTPQLASSALIASNKDESLEKSIAQKKMELTKGNENITKVSKTLVPAYQIKQLTKALSASSKVNSNISNIASTVKTPSKILLKSNPISPSGNNLASTSTPKAQTLIPSKTLESISGKRPGLLVTGLASKVESNEQYITDVPSTSKKKSVESSTSVSACDGARWSLGTVSVPSLQTARLTCVGRPSLNATEMLTIQIPNDKLQTDKVALTGISNGESSSPPNSRNVAMLRILTKEQLNNKYSKIQVKQGPTGRTVTVGALSPLRRDDAARSASSSPTPRVFTEAGSDKSEKILYCDNRLFINESTSRRDKKRPGESMVADSEESTAVRLRSKGNACNDRTINFTVSTTVLVNDNAHNNTSVDSEESTLVLSYDNSECRGSLGMARMNEAEDGTFATNAMGPKQTKAQAKESWEKIRSDVKTELEMIMALAATQQKIILTESQENLVAKRNMVLDDLTEMSGCLRQWELEREIQTKLMAEVRFLREKLRTAENRLHEQRRQINSMGPKVTKAHEKINHGRRECYKLSRICNGLGTKIIGEDYKYDLRRPMVVHVSHLKNSRIPKVIQDKDALACYPKVPETSAKLLNERLKEVAIHTRQLSKKKVPPFCSLSDSRDTNSHALSTASDTVSESSFAERLSNLTTPSSENTNIEETSNSLASENDLDDNRVTRELIEPPEVETSLCSNSISEWADASSEVENESSQVNIVSEETRTSSSGNMANEKGTISSRMNAQTMEIEKSNPFDITEASSSSECNANDDSDIPTTSLISIGRNEDISMPSTSKSHPHCHLVSSNEKPTVKLKIHPYKSVLTHLKASRSVNPDGILCPYELMGTCSDGDCQFYHLDPAHCQ